LQWQLVVIPLNFNWRKVLIFSSGSTGDTTRGVFAEWRGGKWKKQVRKIPTQQCLGLQGKNAKKNFCDGTDKVEQICECQ